MYALYKEYLLHIWIYREEESALQTQIEHKKKLMQILTYELTDNLLDWKFCLHFLLYSISISFITVYRLFEPY